MMKILLVQTSFLGDTILSTPVIAGIRQAHSNSRLWMMTTPQSAHLVAREPLLSGVISFDKRGKEAGISGIFRMARRLKAMKFDRVYSLHRSSRTAVLLSLSAIPSRIGFKDAKLSLFYNKRQFRSLKNHDVIRNLSLLFGEIPIKSLKTDLRLFAPGKDELTEAVREMLPQSRRPIVLVPGSVWNTKMWPWESYREVAKYLRRKGYPIVLDGAPSDKILLDKIAKDIDVINLAGKSTIADAMYIIKHARLVICNDSMALHMASAFKVPNVAIFCATSPSFGFYPWKNNAIVVEKTGLECKPCGRHGGKKCRTGTHACMEELAPDEVITAAEKLLI